MRFHRLLLLVFAFAGLTVAGSAQAAPGDIEFVTSVNTTGGAFVTNVAMFFGPPELTFNGGARGTYTWGPVTGTYTYYSEARVTVFYGLYRAGGELIHMTGYVFNDTPGGFLPPPLGAPGQVLGYAQIIGFGLTGIHTLTSQ